MSILAGLAVLALRPPQLPTGPPRWVEKDEPCRLQDMLGMTGATYRQLDYWWRNGYFGGDTGEGLGSGRQRVWTGREQRIAELMVRLGRAGIEKASVAARIARDGVDGNVRSVTTEDGIAIAWRRIV